MEQFEQKYPPKILKLKYSGDAMDSINFIESIAEELIDLGISLEILEGGDGYEEIKLSKLF
jgi:hypothetical protein